MDETTRRAFSIANIQDGSNRLELHIGGAKQSQYLADILGYLHNAYHQGQRLLIDAPHGCAWLRENSERPLLLIAGGTGFSYIQSILRYSLNHYPERDVYLYWGGCYQEHLYFDDEVTALSQEYEHLTYIPVVEKASAGWFGKIGQVINVVYDNFQSLEDMDIYLCGSRDMVCGARYCFVRYRKAVISRVISDALM
ncbi:NAD(P)H-flavin reductase [Elysia marginata]|uniref:NAD(P)H-flavin reductase n=1 Tax=Elysia marginata TaxID=1093978 RepID=A0AAV4HZD2_9GAST|nr:NAD(P)H-flavin reductase [Elysia marginata]